MAGSTQRPPQPVSGNWMTPVDRGVGGAGGSAEQGGNGEVCVGGWHRQGVTCEIGDLSVAGLAPSRSALPTITGSDLSVAGSAPGLQCIRA